MATINAASCSFVHVQAAIALASNGDTVSIPAGSATWNSVLTIDKFIYLIGAGSTLTHITGNVGAGWDIYLIDFYVDNPDLDLPFRLSGFDFNGNSNCMLLRLWCQQGYILHNVRIDHNLFRGAPGNYNTMARRGPVYGVADNNTFQAGTNQQICDNALWAEWCWENTNPEFGTANNFYFEDNIMTGNGVCVSAGGQGGRYALRYNTITNNTDNVYWMFDMHGSYDVGMLATMCLEIYGNTIGGATSVGSLDQRGSKCFFYNNTFSNNGVYVQVRNEYAENVDVLYAPATSPDGQTKRVNSSYYWNNKNNGTLIYPNVPSQDEGAGGTAWYAALNRWVPYPDKDFWTQNPNFTGSANLSQTYDNVNVGTVTIAGMGVGLLSARPVSCTVADVGYWATDTNTLYRWHNGAWETFYTPYTYPHPLRGEAVQTYTLGIVPTSRTVSKGAIASYEVTVNADDGFTNNVTLGVAGLPVGTTPTFETNPLGPDETTTMEIDTDAIAPGTLNLKVTGEEI